MYKAFGERSVLPLGIGLKLGEGPHLHGIDQLLFGAETRFTLSGSVRLLDGPNTVESLGVPRRPMASLYHPTAVLNHADGTATYVLPMTSSVWEIDGLNLSGRTHPAACLYFHAGRGWRRRRPSPLRNAQKS